MNRKREIGETVAQCGYSLKRLARRAFPNEPNSSLEIHVIDQYLNGLGNYELKKHLTFKHPQTLQQAISCASEYEAIEGPLDKIREPTFCPVSESGDKVLAVKQKSKKVEEKEDLESILSRLLDEKLQKLSTEKLESERHKSKFSPQPQTSTQFKSFIRERERENEQRTYPVRNIVCDYCGRVGHRQSRCYIKQRNEGNRKSSKTPEKVSALSQNDKSEN